MERDGTFPIVNAGNYPPELVEVCRLWNTRPEVLLGWSVRKDGVSIILPSGAKAGASVAGEWKERLYHEDTKGSDEEKSSKSEAPSAEEPGADAGLMPKVRSVTTRHRGR